MDAPNSSRSLPPDQQSQRSKQSSTEQTNEENAPSIPTEKENSPEELWTGKEAEACRAAVKKCKMCCRLVNCNFKANFVNFNKPFLVRVKNKIKRLFTGSC